MASQNHGDDEKNISAGYLSSTMSSSTLEIVLDDQSLGNSIDEESNDHPRKLRVGTTNNEDSTYRQRQQIQLRDPKSHRLIEKRRRDRMNTCLNELLQLTPHKNNASQRRIEKTEIIEMAIDYIRQLISAIEKNSTTTQSSVEHYRTGYRNGLSDVFEFLHEYSDYDQLLIDITQYFKEKDNDLKDLTALPERKRPKYVPLTDKRIKSTSLSNEQSSKTNSSNKTDDKLCIISTVEECTHNEHQSSTSERQQTSTEQYDSTVQVPIFVLHPSGTHYIPMFIDSSIVSHAFTRNSTQSHPPSTTNSTQCHPVSIPVNFNPIVALTVPYELEAQNINVIGTRHQTSVRPN